MSEHVIKWFGNTKRPVADVALTLWHRYEVSIFKRKKIEGSNSFSGVTDTPCFGILVTSAMGFKAKLDPSFASFIAFVQCIS